MNLLKHIKIPLYHIIRIIFPIIFPIISQPTIISLIISLLYHYYTDYFSINSDYIKVLHPNFQELASGILTPWTKQVHTSMY